MHFLWCPKKDIWVETCFARVYHIEENFAGEDVVSFECGECGGHHKSRVVPQGVECEPV